MLGGDPDRVFEPGVAPFAEFVRYLARLPGFRHGESKALVVMTRLAPLESIVVAHRSLVRHVPELARSMWLLFWDDETLPGLPKTLVEQGHLAGLAEEAPIWQARTGPRFMLLSTRTTARALRERIGSLESDAHASSGVRPRQRGGQKSRFG
jgi:hypothetical protein